MQDSVNLSKLTDEQKARLGESDHRPNVYFDEDTEQFVIRASTMNDCTRSLVAAGLDLPSSPPPDNRLDRFDESTLLEDAVLARLAAGDYSWYGSRVKGTVKINLLDPTDMGSYAYAGPNVAWKDGANQFVVKIPVGPDTVVRGSMDGLGIIYERPSRFSLLPAEAKVVVPEVKILGPDLWKKFLKGGLAAFPRYEWQSGVYHLGVRMGYHTPEEVVLFFVVAEKVIEENDEGDRIVKLGDIMVQPFAEPPMSLGKLKLRGRQIINALNLAFDEGLPDKCDQNMYPCPYYQTHDDETHVDLKSEREAAVVKTDSIEDRNEREKIEWMIEQYRTHQRDESAAKKLKEQYKADLLAAVKKYAGDRGGITYGTISVTNVHETWPEQTIVKKAGEKDYIVVKDSRDARNTRRNSNSRGDAAERSE